MQINSIYSSNPEWNYCYFRLQLILSHPNLQILSIQRNPNKNAFFTDKQNYFKIDAALDVSQSTQAQINSYKTNTKKANIFNCGRIQQQSKYFDGMGNKKTYKLLLFKIAVKQTLPIYQTNSLTKQDLYNCCQQYDSIYISTKKQEIMVYDHEYFIRSPSQYIWQYQIEYQYANPNDQNSTIRKWNPQIYKCQQCQINKGYWYCIEEKNIFCRQCFQQAHKGRNRMNHRKQIITPFNCHKKCQKAAHNANILQFYCIQCKELKCAKCMNDINHSHINRDINSQNRINPPSGSSFKVRKSAHQTIQINELFFEFKKKEQNLTSELKGKITQIIKDLQTILSNINRKYEEELHDLQRRLAASVKQIKQKSLKQTNRIISIHLQLKRKFDEILWMQKFVQYNQQVLDAQSNIKLKELFMQFVGLMNAEQYFKKIQGKLSQINFNKIKK